MRPALLALCLCGGCADANAVLELYVELPAAPASGPQHALIQARRADVFAFDVDWVDSRDPPAVALGPTATEDHISIESVGEDDFDLNVRIRWCESVGCTDAVDDPSTAPQTCLVLDHPFYLTHRTEYHVERLVIADAAPGPCATATMVDRCAIRGCVAGDTSDDYCRADGSHLCE